MLQSYIAHKLLDWDLDNIKVKVTMRNNIGEFKVQSYSRQVLETCNMTIPIKTVKLIDFHCIGRGIPFSHLKEPNYLISALYLIGM
jgi:hypothetical protein